MAGRKEVRVKFQKWQNGDRSALNQGWRERGQRNGLELNYDWHKRGCCN